MEKIIYPLKNMWITCIPGQYLHKYCQAIDDQGKDYTTIDKVYAPYTGKVVRKYPSECEIWFESMDKVEFADGTIDYATILFAHKDKYDDIKEGVVYKQGEVIYSEGTKASNKIGGADRHVHFEACAGKTTGSGWVKAKDGTWNLAKGKNPADVYFIDDSINIIKTGGISFKKIETIALTKPVERDENKKQLKVLVDLLRVRENHSTNSNSLGYAVNGGVYNDLEEYYDGIYTWHKIADNQWIADDGSWLELYDVKDYKTLYEEEQKVNEELKNANQKLLNSIDELNKTISEATNKLKQINELSK